MNLNKSLYFLRFISIFLALQGISASGWESNHYILLAVLSFCFSSYLFLFSIYICIIKELSSSLLNILLYLLDTFITLHFELYLSLLVFHICISVSYISLDIGKSYSLLVLYSLFTFNYCSSLQNIYVYISILFPFSFFYSLLSYFLSF